MTLAFHGSWIVCALAATACAVVAPRSGRAAVLGVFTWAMALWLSAGAMPAPELVGTVAAVVAATCLARPSWSLLAAAGAGMLAAWWGRLLVGQGLAVGPAVIIAAAVPLVALVQRRREPAFAPDAVQEEALLVVVVLGLVVAMMPGVSEGWQAAGNLSVQGADATVQDAVPGWTLAVVGVALASGAGYAVWSRR